MRRLIRETPTQPGNCGFFFVNDLDFKKFGWIFFGLLITKILPVVDWPDINSPAQSLASFIHPRSLDICGVSDRLCDLRSLRSHSNISFGLFGPCCCLALACCCWPVGKACDDPNSTPENKNSNNRYRSTMKIPVCEFAKRNFI